LTLVDRLSVQLAEATTRTDQAECRVPVAPQNRPPRWHDALVTWWERVLAGVVVVLVALLIDLIIV
jgi:hypothetical protein